jgi:peptidase M23-like protein
MRIGRAALMIFAVGCLLLAVSFASADTPLLDVGPFGPDRVALRDGRVVDIPPETLALYRMLTQTGRIHGRHTAHPTETDAQAGIELRHRHEPYWATLFGDHARTAESDYVPPIEHGWLSRHPGYKPGHRAEDVFAPPGRRVAAPAAMLILHAGYLSKTAGEAVVGFVPPGPDQPRARYFTFVHVDASPARVRLGEVVDAGTLIGYVAKGNEAVVGSGLGRPPHLHFSIAEERPDGKLEGIRIWSLLRRISGAHVRRA